MLRKGLLVLFALLAGALPARAQAPNGCSYKWSVNSEQAISSEETHHTRLVRQVRIDCNDIQLFADEGELFTDTDRMRASGNVLFVSSSNRISADRLEFNWRTKTGTFYNASGIASLEARGVDRSFFGTQEPDAYFWGETIEKLGPKTYRIRRGGFSTCVQPTPRWELVSNEVTLTLEKHAFIKNAVLKVKDVPVFYLPAMYYPINKEDRATGFLIPVYGSSDIKGQTLSNAFFWAINRSQDATVLHDWYSKTGQGYGGEYRYNAGSGDGNIRTYFDNQHEATYTVDNTTTVQPASQSYEIRGSASQILPGNLRSRASVDYFSDIATSQTFNTNIYDASRNQRRFGANVIGAWGKYAMNATIDHTEYFNSLTDSTLSGSLPRVSFTRNERPILDSPAYFSITTEYFKELRATKSATTDTDMSLDRVDIAPQLRYPFKKWQWFTVNSTVSWRDTFYTRSYSPTGAVIDDSLNRTLYTLQSQIVGPVFRFVVAVFDPRSSPKYSVVTEK